MPGGDVLVVEYTPFNENGINYTGNERDYLKPHVVKLSILEDGHNGYTGQYLVVLSKDLQGDPMEIKVLWYTIKEYTLYGKRIKWIFSS